MELSNCPSSTVVLPHTYRGMEVLWLRAKSRRETLYVWQWIPVVSWLGDGEFAVERIFGWNRIADFFLRTLEDRISMGSRSGWPLTVCRLGFRSCLLGRLQVFCIAIASLQMQDWRTEKLARLVSRYLEMCSIVLA